MSSSVGRSGRRVLAAYSGDGGADLILVRRARVPRVHFKSDFSLLK